MTVARIDVTQYGDTELGAEVRHLHAEGHAMLILFDSSQPDRRASTWVDGTSGLYKMECEKDHVWLTAIDEHMSPLQGECTICGLPGEWVED